MKKNIIATITTMLCLGMLTGCAAQGNHAVNAPPSSPVLDISAPESTPNTISYTAAYDKLISFKVDNYISESVAVFNRSLTPENGDLSEILDTHATALTSVSTNDENYVFIRATLSASLNELYSKQLGEETTFSGYVKKVAHPIEALNEEEKELLNNESSYQFHFMAFYNLHYTIADANTLTVGDRDYALQTFNTELQSFVDMLSKSELTSSNIRTTLSKKADEIARDLSSENLKLTCEINGIEVHNDGVDSQTT